MRNRITFRWAASTSATSSSTSARDLAVVPTQLQIARVSRMGLPVSGVCVLDGATMGVAVAASAGLTVAIGVAREAPPQLVNPIATMSNSQTARIKRLRRMMKGLVQGVACGHSFNGGRVRGSR